MLRGLAEYSMSGRRQAVTVALLFGLLPMFNLLSGAVVALVTLRKGWQEGFLVLLWALLPAGLQLLLGDASPVFMLCAALLTAQLLRTSSSWPKVLMLMTALGLLAQLSLSVQPSYVAQVTQVIDQMMAEGKTLQLADAGQMSSATVADVVAMLLQFYGSYHFVIFAVCLILGRHWQALLYNPGGFRQEFHALRLDPRFAGLLLALLLAGELGLAPLNAWVPLFCMAPLLNGLALIHHVVAQRKSGMNWLILAYLAALLMAPAIILLGFADSFANIRKRLQPEAK
jgi:hypothetical protein